MYDAEIAIDTELLNEVEQLLPTSVREDFCEHHSDWAEISSLMVDINWEIMFIDLAGLDQIIALSDVQAAASSYSDPTHPLWKIDKKIESLGPGAQDLAARILQFHLWQNARSFLKKTTLSDEDYRHWLEKQAKPDPKHKVDWENLPESRAGDSLYEKRNHEIAQFVIREYPEETAYIVADIEDFFIIENLPYYAGRLLTPQRRIFQTMLHLFGSAHTYDSHTWTGGEIIRDVMGIIREIEKPPEAASDAANRP